MAATMTGAAFLGVMSIPSASRNASDRLLRFMVSTLDERLRILKNAVRKERKRLGRDWWATAPT